MTQVINGITVRSQYRDQGIPGCPPLTTAMPMQHMSGITTQELIVFFPNHALKVHAIGTRILAEKFSQAEVCRLLHLSRGLGIDPPKESVLAPANTIRVQLRACKEAVLKDIFHCGMDINLVTQTQIEGLQWAWVGKPRSKVQPLLPAWPLQAIAVRFPGNVLELPDMGAFTLLIKDAYRQYQNVQALNPDVLLAPQADLPSITPASNPPQLPSAWHLGCNINFRAVMLFSDAGGFNNIAGSVLRFSRDSRLTDVGTVLTQYNHDAHRIMCEAPHLIDGEVLIYFCARHGFCMTLAQIADYIKDVHPPGIKPLSKSAYSHRMGDALNARARKNGTTIAQERDLYIQSEKYIDHANQMKPFPRAAQRPDIPLQPPAGYGPAKSTLPDYGYHYPQPMIFDDSVIDPALLEQSQDSNGNAFISKTGATYPLYDVDWTLSFDERPYFLEQDDETSKRPYAETGDSMEPMTKKQRVC